MFRAALDRLDVTVHVGEESYGRGGPVAVVHRPEEFFARLGRDQLIGFGEAYLTGAWDAEDLGGFLTVLAEEMPRLVPEPLQRLRALVVRRPPRHERSSVANARDNIAHHYDLSNEFYSLVLEPQMAYSCGYHATPDVTLEEAQRAKLDLVCTKLGLQPGMRMLDVGCGWGSLSLHAAEHFGARVVGVTISAEQKTFIDARIAERGLADRVEIRLQDYREVPERDHFDAVGSLEMGEHVGALNYDTYVEVLRRAVKPGGRVLVQQMSRQGAGGGKHPGGGPFIELPYDPPGWTPERRDFMLAEPIRPGADGILRVPPRPGLGAVLDERAMKRYAA
jgi:cyclopropane-fatty-acyl-phospholipid synthase